MSIASALSQADGFAAKRADRARSVALAAVLLVAAAVRLFRLDALSFWLDETATLTYAHGTIVDIWGLDTHPPLYYSLIAGWRQLGESDYLLRLSSVLFSLGSVGAIFFCGEALGGRWTALLAGALLALSPFSIQYAQELRMYALLECVVALSLLGLLRLLRDPAAAVGPLRNAWLLYALGAVLALYTHNFGVLWPLAANTAVLVLLLLGALQWPFVRRWLLVNLAVLALWAPFWPSLIEQTSAVIDDFWFAQPTILEALGQIGYVTLGLGSRFDEVEQALALLFIALAALGLFVLRPRRLSVALLPILVLPPLVAYGCELIGRPLFAPRTLIWTAFPFILALASGLSWLLERPSARLRLGVAGIALVMLVLAVRAGAVSNAYDRISKPDWRTLVAQMSWLTEPGDKVAVLPGKERSSYGHYRSRQEAEGRPTPPPADQRFSSKNLDALNALAGSLAVGERLWILQSQWYVQGNPAARVLEAHPCLQASHRIEALFVNGTLLTAGPQCRAGT